MVVPLGQRAPAVMETLPRRGAKDFLALGKVVHAEEGLGHLLYP